MKDATIPDYMNMSPAERSIETTTNGRYLIHSPGPGKSLLVGFHGYAEAAEAELERLLTTNGSNRWTVAAIQGLHRFYRGRSNDVVAGWMTRQDRELAIADNILYTRRAIDAISTETSASGILVLSGFSQGVAMAFRCAAGITRSVGGVVALGGDVPPELDGSALSRIPHVLLGRGVRDEWYTPEKMDADLRRLTVAGVIVETVTFDGGHEWTLDFGRAVSRFLQQRIGLD
jgi:predicted esterase